jgi:cytidylate kinase
MGPVNGLSDTADGHGGLSPRGWSWGWSQFLARWLRRSARSDGSQDLAAERRARFRNVCISREVGSGAGTIARLAGTRLGWKVYDHELIEGIAHRMEVPIEEAKVYDELAPSVIQDWLLPMREEHYAPHEAYLDHLAKLVEAIGKAGESIIVGRGAGFLLPRNETLSVRIIAPLKVRAQRVAERLGVSWRTARRAVREQDARHLKFARVMYRVDANDPHQYDLVLDSDSLGLTIATEVLVRVVQAGSGREQESQAGEAALFHPTGKPARPLDEI